MWVGEAALTHRIHAVAGDAGGGGGGMHARTHTHAHFRPSPFRGRTHYTGIQANQDLVLPPPPPRLPPLTESFLYPHPGRRETRSASHPKCLVLFEKREEEAYSLSLGCPCPPPPFSKVEGKGGRECHDCLAPSLVLTRQRAQSKR